MSWQADSTSSPEDCSLFHPLLPLDDRGDENRCTLDRIVEDDSSRSCLNESSDDCFYRYERYNGNPRNIRRILASTWFGFTGRAIWSQNVLSILFYLLYPHRPERIGYITAAMGLAQVLSTMMTRCCLSPSWKRHHILRLASLVGLGAIGTTVYALLVEEEWYWLLGGLSAWGFMWGMTDVAMPTLFADSLPDDDEPMYYTRASRIIRSSNVIGPLIVLALFHLYLGDHWTIYNCSIVMAFGLGFCLPMVLLLCCLLEVNEECDVDFPDEILLDDIPLGSDDAPMDPKMDLSTAAADISGNATEETAAITAALDSSHTREHEDSTVCGCCLQSVIVPTLVSIASIISAVASGISIQYFPVFFVDHLHLSPIFVQVLYLVLPLGQAIANYVARRLARLCGASFVTVLLQWTFVTVLASMLYCYQQGMSAWIVQGLYLCHAFLMNSTTALTQSLLWSAIPEESVSKWTIAETLQLLLWSTGAGAGGWLVGNQSLVICFWATAALQLLASMPVVLLCCVGPSRARVNIILFPGSPTYSHVDSPFHSLNDPDESSEGTHFEDSREILESSVGEASSGVFHDCCSAAQSQAEAGRAAFYDRSRRCCVFHDGSAAHVPAGASVDRIPANFLQICHGDSGKAIKRWTATQEWRRQTQVWKIHTLPNHWYLRIKEAYPHSIHGFSMQGYPVIYEQPGKMKLKQLFREGCTVADMTRWYTFFMEYLSNCVKGPSDEESSSSPRAGCDWGFVVVMDMREAGISMLSSDVLSYLKQAGEINSAHYPLSMKQSYLVNAGTVVAGIWSGIRKVVPETVHMEIFESPSSLLDYIDQDQIPVEFGGTSPFILGQHPDEVALRTLVESLTER